MIPVRLEIKNFLAYRSPDPLRFEGIHLACLTGANGAGKSSLLDAITWALWGEARAKRDDDLVHIGQSDMHVQLDFEQEGTIYRVLRRRSRKQRGVGTLDLFALVDGQPNTLSEPSIRETQQKINRLLKLDYETFVHSAFLQQGKADAFTTKPPAQRKQILSDILGLAQWEKYEEAAKEILKNISNELMVIEQRIRDIDEELKKEPGFRKVLAEAEQAQQEAADALKVAEEKLAEVAHAPGAMKTAQERLAEAERRRKEHTRDLTAIEDDIQRQNARIAEYQGIINSRQEIEKGYATLQSARQMDSELGQKLLKLSDFDAQRRELENRLRDARAELENEASGYESLIGELEGTIEEASSDDLSAVQTEITGLRSIEERRNDYQSNILTLTEEKARLETLRNSLREEGQATGERLKQLEATEGVTCPLCGQPLDEEHRKQLMDELEQENEKRRENYRLNEEAIKTVTKDLKDGRKQISEWEDTLKTLQPLLERAGALQSSLDTAHRAESRLTETQARLDAVRATLAEEAFGQDVRDQLRALDGQRDGIGYDRSSHDAAREQLDTYREYDTRQKQLEVALNTLPHLGDALEGAKLREERTRKALSEDDAAVEGLKREIAELAVLVKEQQNRLQQRNHLQTFERQQYQRLVNARQELDALDKQRARKGEMEKRRDVRRHDESLYKELRIAFSKNGVPAMIIEAAIPELEETANNLLLRMTDGRMSLRFTTQREKLSSEGVIETLDIEIADELGTRNYELYSGGEAFRINFAIRVALSQLLAHRAGAHLRTLFIDEGFGTQDEDGRNKLVEAITAIQNDFDLILVITHIDDLRDSFPVHVVVQKTPSGSRVSVR